MVENFSTIFVVWKSDCKSGFIYLLFLMGMTNSSALIAGTLRDERAGCFTLFVFLVSRDCCVALPHDFKGLSAICDFGIS